MLHSALEQAFACYSANEAPFCYRQRMAWSALKPLAGLRLLHHVPVFANTLLKIACLVEAGAEVSVCNPESFCKADPAAVDVIKRAGLRYIDDPASLRGQSFDLYLDCGAELYQTLGAPRLGAVELTGSGDRFYRRQLLDFPVISIDRSGTKQLETVFGCAQSSQQALFELTGQDPKTLRWLIWGFGKIGRGLAYFCHRHHIPVVVVDMDARQREHAVQLGLPTVDPADLSALRQAVDQAELIITATGIEAALAPYPRVWFTNKLLANLGIYDEFGPGFNVSEVLNNKKPINFILQDPTPMSYIDPEFYLHNMSATLLLHSPLAAGVHDVSVEVDQTIIHEWCGFHGGYFDDIHRWFYQSL